MLLIVYLAVLIPAVYWVVKTLGPEMAKPPEPKVDQEKKYFEFLETTESDHRIKKLEILLEEKNKNIGLLQKELRALYVQVREFEKIRSLLEEEIHRLKEQNRIFRSELGISPVASPGANRLAPENSLRLFL